MKKFGQEISLWAAPVKIKNPVKWAKIALKLCELLHMTPQGLPQVWRYPTLDGKGGVGETVFLPITESFIAIDAWSDFKGAYVVICSCKPFLESQVRLFFAMHEISVGESTSKKMELS